MSDDGSGSASARLSIVAESTPSGLKAGTGVALIFDDGYDGVTLVDPERRVAVRHPIAGQRAGDQPARLSLVDDALIVGWGEVYAAPLDGSSSRLLGDATISIPEAEWDLVWLVDYPGERVGTGKPTFRQVDTAGNVLFQAVGPDLVQTHPAIGVLGGVAFETAQGVALWDAGSGAIWRLGSTQAFVGDSHDELLAWCEGLCETLHITRLGGQDVAAKLPPGATTFDPKSSRFSRNGGWLAVNAPGAGVALINTSSGEVRTFPTPGRDEFFSLGWSPDGRHVFFSSDSYGSDETVLGRYDVATESVVSETLPFGGALSFVAVWRERVSALFDASAGQSEACPPPTIQPSERTGPCAFEF